MRKEDQTAPVHIVSLEVQNFRRLTAAVINIIPDKGMVRVTGLNNSGKTSLLKAIAGALGGGGEIHKESLREGAKDGLVSLKLSNGFTIERRFTEKNPKGYLQVTGPDDGRHAQAKLTGWLGDRSFDPLAFFYLPKEAQRDALFSIAKDPDLPEKLTKLRGIQKENYDLRTPWIVKKREINKILEHAPKGEAPELVDTKATLLTLQQLKDQQVTYANMGNRAREATFDLKNASLNIRNKIAQMDGLKADLLECEKELARMETQYEEAKKKRAHIDKEFEGLADVSGAIQDAQELLASATEVMKAREPWERHAKALAEVKVVDQTENKLTAQIRGHRNQEVHLLKESGIPVAGIGFDDQGFAQLNGRSLEVASGRERIEVAVAVALAADPEIRVCLVDEANDLDLDALAALDTLAKRHGFQIWVVRIGLEGDGEIVVEDGVAKNKAEK